MMYIPTPQQVNELINRPDVRPATVPAKVSYMDARPFLSEPCNAALAYAGGVCLFEHLGRGSYEAHMFLLPGGRGAQGLEFGRSAMRWLFDVVKGERIVVAAPYLLPQVRFYCRRLGMESTGRDLFHEFFQAEAV